MNLRNNSVVVAKERCPRCAKRGMDTRGNNLAVYSDGHSYCYGCGYFTTTDKLKALRSSTNTMASTSNIDSLSMENTTFKLPPAPLRWLDSYGVTEQERIVHRIVYDLHKDLLVFPVYDGDRLVVANCRYFGDDKNHPKYITKGWKSGHFKLFEHKGSNVYVLTEDFISALKVSRVANSIPLLGAYFPRELVLSLMHRQPILRIWLDKDKANSSVAMANRSRQWLPECATIITEKDPKEYETKEINEFILQSIKSIPQS